MPDVNSNDLSSSINHCMLLSQTCNITSDHLKASNCLHFTPQCAFSLSSLFSSMSLGTLAVLHSKAVDYFYESYQSLLTWLIKFLRFSSSFLHLFLLPAHSCQNRWHQRTAEADQTVTQSEFTELHSVSQMNPQNLDFFCLPPKTVTVFCTAAFPMLISQTFIQ
jgi:hypothetical protein